MVNNGSRTAGLVLVFVVSMVFLILSLVHSDFIALAVISLIVGLVLLLRSGGSEQKETSKVIIRRTVLPQNYRPQHNATSNKESSLDYLTSDILLNGRYQIEKQLKKGGMSIIALARDTETDSYCVIKTPRYDTVHDTDINVEKLTLEAAFLKQIDHPNIVKYLDLFTYDNMLYLVEEYVEGDNLFDVFNIEPADEGRVLKWGEQLLNALEHMHRRGLIHRDVNPGNIMLKPNDNVVIVDFGTAKTAATEGLTIVKTPGFEVPEQVATGYADERSDLFGAGSTLFYLLTSAPPGSIGNRNVAEILLSKGVSIRTTRCIAQTLQMDSGLRFQNAAAMRWALCGL